MNLFFLASLQVLLDFLKNVSCVISAILFFIPSHVTSTVSHKCKYLKFKSVSFTLSVFLFLQVGILL